MLNSYSKYWLQYKQLWAKYGSCIAKISTQEESIYWSLQLIKTLETLAKEQGKDSKTLIVAFVDGVTNEKNNLIKQGLKQVCAAINNNLNEEDIIKRFSLFFDINNIDDLFLNDEAEKIVY